MARNKRYDHLLRRSRNYQRFLARLSLSGSRFKRRVSSAGHQVYDSGDTWLTDMPTSYGSAGSGSVQRSCELAWAKFDYDHVKFLRFNIARELSPLDLRVLNGLLPFKDGAELVQNRRGRLLLDQGERTPSGRIAWSRMLNVGDGLIVDWDGNITHTYGMTDSARHQLDEFDGQLEAYSQWWEARMRSGASIREGFWGDHEVGFTRGHPPDAYALLHAVETFHYDPSFTEDVLGSYHSFDYSLNITPRGTFVGNERHTNLTELDYARHLMKRRIRKRVTPVFMSPIPVNPENDAGGGVSYGQGF